MVFLGVYGGGGGLGAGLIVSGSAKAAASLLDLRSGKEEDLTFGGARQGWVGAFFQAQRDT